MTTPRGRDAARRADALVRRHRGWVLPEVGCQQRVWVARHVGAGTYRALEEEPPVRIDAGAADGEDGEFEDQYDTARVAAVVTAHGEGRRSVFWGRHTAIDPSWYLGASPCPPLADFPRTGACGPAHPTGDRPGSVPQ